ncbi:MAG: hypothetical protein PHN80_13030 [Hespellia sp.]|nr:hypothetical protein [Hespellia sp.]
MKKNELLMGYLFAFGGLILVLTGLWANAILSSFLIASGVGAFGSGTVLVCKYYYWNLPKNRKRYEEKIIEEDIEIHDELQIKLRDKSGRYTTILGNFTICISIVIFSVLGKCGIVDNSRIIVMFLSGYLLFQLASYNLILKYLFSVC